MRGTHRRMAKQEEEKEMPKVEFKRVQVRQVDQSAVTLRSMALESNNHPDAASVGSHGGPTALSTGRLPGQAQTKPVVVIIGRTVIEALENSEWLQHLDPRKQPAVAFATECAAMPDELAASIFEALQVCVLLIRILVLFTFEIFAFRLKRMPPVGRPLDPEGLCGLMHSTAYGVLELQCHHVPGG